ncbi:MAG: glycosyltransferase family 1 protein [Snowella sp.]|nr:glycosyltransferase family 1 protein [Snowella sp.]
MTKVQTVGYWFGDSSINNGGTNSYALRLLELILSHEKKDLINILIICSHSNQIDCQKLIEKYDSNAKIAILPKFNFFQKIINKFSDFFIEIIKEKGFNLQFIKEFNFYFHWYKSLNIDLLHIPYPTSPRYDLIYPFIITTHDVQELHYPEFFTPKERAYRAENYWKSLEFCSGVVVSYDHVKKDIIKYFKLSNEKINVCPLPYQKISLQQPSLLEENIYKQKYKLYDYFLLYPAQTWEHKNHLSLIKSLEIIEKNYDKSVHLICTGRKNSDFFSTIENYLIQSSIANKVHFVDIVPEQELYWLYKNCSLVVVPTLYEAGSFPLLEAMSLNAPVICSSVTSLPETIQDSRFIFEPLDLEQMAKLIIQMLEDQQLRQENINNGKNRTKELMNIDPFPCYLTLWNNILE